MLGLQLKRYRKHVLHITQHEMAAALETSASYISGLEVGQITNPGGAFVKKFREVYGVDLMNLDDSDSDSSYVHDPVSAIPSTGLSP